MHLHRTRATGTGHRTRAPGFVVLATGTRSRPCSASSAAILRPCSASGPAGAATAASVSSAGTAYGMCTPWAAAMSRRSCPPRLPLPAPAPARCVSCADGEPVEDPGGCLDTARGVGSAPVPEGHGHPSRSMPERRCTSPVESPDARTATRISPGPACGAPPPRRAVGSQTAHRAAGGGHRVDLRRGRRALRTQAPTVPSTPSRRKSACPLWRPYSKSTWTITMRSDTSWPHLG